MDLALSVLAVRYRQIIAGPVERTDDYRLYCLSQAQSTLIQQSYLHVIYRSLRPAVLPRLSPFSPTLFPLLFSSFFGSHNPRIHIQLPTTFAIVWSCDTGSVLALKTLLKKHKAQSRINNYCASHLLSQMSILFTIKWPVISLKQTG